MPKIGLTGLIPRDPPEWYPFSLESTWTVATKTLARRKGVVLHKLRNNTDLSAVNPETDACEEAVELIVERLRADVVGRQMGDRVLQLLNEPDVNSDTESNWRDDPIGAANWCAKVIHAVRRWCPWVRFCGPNILYMNTEWVMAFFGRLVERRAPLDIYGLHGYLLWYWGWDWVIGHLDDIIRTASPLALAPNYPVWFTELGALHGESVADVRNIMKDAEQFHILHGGRFGVDAYQWFISSVSAGSFWDVRSPNTKVFETPALGAPLTPAGKTWWRIWRDLDHSA